MNNVGLGIFRGIVGTIALVVSVTAVTSFFDTTTNFGEWRSLADRIRDLLIGAVVTVALIAVMAYAREILGWFNRR